MTNYDYKLANFEGPLDLLLHLIEKNQIDIYDIPIVEITSQYMARLDEWNQFDIAYSSEFLVMAATLLQIKSRMLLPKVPRAGEALEDPRDELVEQLVEFKRMKELARLLESQVDVSDKSVSRSIELSQIGIDTVIDVPSKLLIEAFLRLRSRTPKTVAKPKPMHMVRETFTVEAMVSRLQQRLGQGPVDFYQFLGQSTHKSEQVTILLAALELVKQQVITIVETEQSVLLKEVV